MTMTTDVRSEALVLAEVRDGVATVTLNRPAQFNALSAALIAELQAALDRIAADRSVRVVVLGANGRGFCAGHDLKEIRAMGDVAEVEALFARCSRMMMSLGTLPQPVIAKVHGIATAAGCQLVASCDLAVSSAEARFATPGVNIGAFCSTPSVPLGRVVARKHAMEMLLTGNFVDAQRAYEIGLVNRVVAPDALDAAVEELARLLASKSPMAIASGKRVFYQQLDLAVADAYAIAGHAIACDFFGEDGREGVDAFLQKRTPNWKGSMDGTVRNE
jgi:enoyl-CoA hydratase/carnithine racemase